MAAHRAPAEPPPIPLAERPRLEPLDGHQFVLESAEHSVIGEPQIVFAREADTFSELAREYGLGYDEIVAANPDVDPWLPGEGTPVVLPTQYVLPDAPRRGIVLNIAAKRLFYFPEAADGEPTPVMTFPIGIGRVGWETPLGDAEVISKARDPHWWVPASVRKEHAELGDPLPAVVPPGPDNPLGRYVLKLDMPGYLIHGTNQPYGVGMRVSHGCVRLYPENIEFLYPLVALGAPVRIVNQPYLIGRRGEATLFQAHAPLEDDTEAPEDRLAAAVATLEVAEGEREGLATRVAAAADEALGVAVMLGVDTADDITTRARLVQNTVEPDPEGPTLAEVRAILDAPLEELEDAEREAAADETGND